MAAGTTAFALMTLAGEAAAEAIWRHAGRRPALILCGPGNNGGDGYVIARALAARGVPVRVAAIAPPRTATAMEAAAGWSGSVEAFDACAPAPVLVDALFGIGLARGLEPPTAARLMALAEAAAVRVAIDMPSGAATDDGRLLSPVPAYDLTITFAAPKPAHLLQPAAAHVGRLVVADIGVAARSRLRVVARPRLPAPTAADHKYRRGYVAVRGGIMPGAAALTAAAAARSGAGYVRLVADAPVAGLPHAIVQGRPARLDDDRIGALVIGPGLGRGADGAQRLDEALACGRPLVLDADALSLLGDRLDRLPFLPHRAILTPHDGEFATLFGAAADGKVEAARAAARRTGAVIVHKGADTVVASPGGRAAIAPQAPAWLATAGTGDVLAGIIGAMRARGLDAFEAACAGVWLHGRAAEAAGSALIADDLLAALPRAVAGCA